MKRKTLYQRMKPDAKYKLELCALEYPQPIDILIDVLRENHSLNNVSYGHVSVLCHFMEIEINDAYDLFEYEIIYEMI